MGCCASRPDARPANLDGPAPVRHDYPPHSSSRELNAPPSRRASVPSSRGSFLNPARDPAAVSSNPNTHHASAVRPNHRLTPIPAGQRSTLPNTLASSATTKSRHRARPLADPSTQPWTQRRLDQERAAWWDTRVTGTREVWACLKWAVEALQLGDVMTAQGLLDAQECTCPNGQLWGEVYDGRGTLYKIPEWLIIEPTGLVEEEDMLASASEDKTNVVDEETDREFKVRARISSTARDFQIQVRRRETVASIRERLRMQAQVDPEDYIRIAYGGRVYAEHEILETNGYWNYENNYILTCYVSSKPSALA